MILLYFSLLYFGCLLPIISLLWSNSFHIPLLVKITALFNVGMFFCALLLIMKCIIERRTFKSMNFLFFILFICLVGVIGTVVGVANGYASKAINDFYLFINGPIIAFAVYVSNINAQQIEHYFRWLAKLFLLFFSLAVAVLLMQTVLDIPHYPAIASNLAIISFCYFLYKHRKWSAFFILLLVFLSGKRSVFLILVGLLPFFYFINKGISIKKVIASGVILSLMLVSILMPVASYMENNIEKFSFGASSIEKFSYLNPMSEKFDVTYAAGERVEEVFDALEAHHANPYSVLVGSGNGFIYPLKVHRKNMYEDERHGVHFAPVDWYTKHGLLFTIAILMIMVSYFRKTLPYAKHKIWYLNTSIFYQIFVVFYSFIATSFGLDLIFWISVGLMIKTIESLNSQNKVVLT